MRMDDDAEKGLSVGKGSCWAQNVWSILALVRINSYGFHPYIITIFKNKNCRDSRDLSLSL